LKNTLQLRIMKTGIFALILIPILFLPGSLKVRAENSEIPPSSADAEELRVISDRLATGLFFRGELADRIMDAGFQARFVRLTGRETRADVRLALLDWIGKNTEEAARLYFYFKGRGSSPVRPPEAAVYRIPSWEINPNFIELVRGVNKAAKDSAAGDEEISLIAQRLFEGPQAPPEAYSPWLPGGSGGAAAQGAGSAAGIKYADYKLDPARVERESRALGVWFELLSAALEAEFGNKEKSYGLSRSHRLLDETFYLYGKFVVALSGLKGRSRITEKEAAGLEAFRRALRKNLGELEALRLMRRINKLAGALRADAPGAKALRADALRIEEGVKAFLAELEGNPESFKSSGRSLYEINTASDFWMLRFSAHGRLSDLKKRMETRFFSCVLDKIVFTYLSRFYRSADYVRLAAAQAGRVKAIDVSLEGIAAGDYNKTAAFSPDGGRKLLIREISEAEADAGRIEAYSRFNRRLQFFLWDVFVNPFGLEPGPRLISAENKLIF